MNIDTLTGFVSDPIAWLAVGILYLARQIAWLKTNFKLLLIRLVKQGSITNEDMEDLSGDNTTLLSQIIGRH